MDAQVTPAPAPQDDAVNVLNPTGDLVSIPKTSLNDALQQGYEQASPDQLNQFLKQQKYGTTGQNIARAVEGLGEGVAGPLFTAGERALGIKPEDILGREQTGAEEKTKWKIAGLVGGPFIPGLGEYSLANMLEHVGAGAASLAGLGAVGAGALSKIAAAGVRGATEMALLQGGDEVSHMLMNDPSQSVDTAMANIGLAGLIGAGGGAALGSISPLWKAAAGDGLGKFAEDFKDRMNFHLNNPEPAEAATDVISNLYDSTKSIGNELRGPTGLKEQAIQKLVPEMNDSITSQVADHLENLDGAIEEMKKNPDKYPTRLINKFQDDVNNYRSVAQNPESTPQDIFKATDFLKRTLHDDAQPLFNKLNPVSTLDEKYPFMKKVSSVAGDLKEGLEDSKVWGGAADLQKTINSAWSEYLPYLKNFNCQFTADVGGERVIDPAKVKTFVNQTGDIKGALKNERLQGFFEGAQKLQGAVNDAHAKLGLEGPVPNVSLGMLNDIMGKSTPGQKVADLLVKKGLSRMAGEGLGAAIGGGIGHMVGAGGIGALIGEHALGPFISSVLPAITKPLISNGSSGVGLKAATDYGLQVIKGKALTLKAAKAVFKSGAEVLPMKQVAQSDRDKLDKKIQDYQLNPEKLLAVGGDVGHYLPDHNTAMGQAAGRAVQYLNSVRPQPVKLAPLDPELKPSKMQDAAYNRTLNIALQPLAPLNHLKNGTLLPGDVKDMTAMFPALYAKVSQELTNNMIDAVSKGQAIPYQMKQSLSLFLGQPLDSSLMPQNIQATQAIFQAQALNKMAAMAPQKKTKAISETSKAYQTSGEATARRQQIG